MIYVCEYRSDMARACRRGRVACCAVPSLSLVVVSSHDSQRRLVGGVAGVVKGAHTEEIARDDGECDAGG